MICIIQITYYNWAKSFAVWDAGTNSMGPFHFTWIWKSEYIQNCIWANGRQHASFIGFWHSCYIQVVSFGSISKFSIFYIIAFIWLVTSPISFSYFSVLKYKVSTQSSTSVSHCVCFTKSCFRACIPLATTSLTVSWIVGLSNSVTAITILV